MKTYRVALKDTFPVAKGTKAFVFERPDNFEFKAGQYVAMTLPDPVETDEIGVIRPLSIASAPYEDHLLFTTRLRDTAFKKSVEALEVGDEVEIEGPKGTFFLHEDETIPAVFLVGGIGVTPVRSMLREAETQGENVPHITLFYSNTNPELKAFHEELESISLVDYEYVPTISDVSAVPDGWSFETGRINFEMIQKYISDVSNPRFYIIGSPDFVKGMSDMLRNNGVDDRQIILDEFSGY